MPKIADESKRRSVRIALQVTEAEYDMLVEMGVRCPNRRRWRCFTERPLMDFNITLGAMRALYYAYEAGLAQTMKEREEKLYARKVAKYESMERRHLRSVRKLEEY